MPVDRHGPVLEVWEYSRSAPGTAIILPDGCRDLIVRSDTDGGRRTLILTDLDGAARSETFAAGEQVRGLRLRPGVTLPKHVIAELRETLGGSFDNTEPAVLVDQVAAAYSVANDDLVEAFALSSTVRIAARRLGVSERTLHRHVRKRTGEAPSFWIDLARARRALLALRAGFPLAQVAFDAGYADQAHLTRAFGVRFGCSPGKFRRNPILMRLAGRPGFAG